MSADWYNLMFSAWLAKVRSATYSARFNMPAGMVITEDDLHDFWSTTFPGWTPYKFCAAIWEKCAEKVWIPLQRWVYILANYYLNIICLLQVYGSDWTINCHFPRGRSIMPSKMLGSCGHIMAICPLKPDLMTQVLPTMPSNVLRPTWPWKRKRLKSGIWLPPMRAKHVPSVQARAWWIQKWVYRFVPCWCQVCFYDLANLATIY